MSTFAKLLPFLDGFGFAPGVLAAHDYEAVWFRCQSAVTAALVAMADAGRLPNIVAASIVDAEQPDVSKLFGPEGKCKKLDYPGLIVWPFQQEATIVTDGSNLTDDIMYSVAVSFVDKGSGATGPNAMIVNPAARARHKLWRERVSRKFRHFQVPEIREVFDVYVRYQLYAVPSIYKNDDLYHGAIVVDFKCQETRDNNGG